MMVWSRERGRLAVRIGELAQATGFTTKAIRYYEGEGLLRAPVRTPSGYRVYALGDAERLEFIKKAKRLGLSLQEIRGILSLHDSREPTCLHVRALLDGKLAQIDGVLRELGEFRREVLQLRDQAGDLENCRPAGGSICTIIERAGIPATAEDVARLEVAIGRKSAAE
jgi:DNA-binding transcriptional MerR regulator